MLAALLLCAAWAAQAQNLTVKVNDGPAQSNKASLEVAITDCGMELGDIRSIEISAGDFTTADWYYLKDNSYSLSSLESFTITDGISSVADMPNSYDFGSYISRSIISVSIDASFAIGDFGFSNCSDLNSIFLPKVTSIGEQAFSYCTALTTVNLPKVTSIGGGAFSNSALRFLNLGATVPSMGEYVFSNCPSPRFLKLVDANGDPLEAQALSTAIDAYKAADDGNTGDNLWYGCRINEQPAPITIKVNDGIEEYTNSSLQSIFETNNIDPVDVTQLEVLSGDLFEADVEYIKSSLTALQKLTLTTAKAFTLVLEWYSLQELHAPELESVGVNAFHGCYYLTTVNLPKATTIGENAFNYCRALITLNLPEATYIGRNAFKDCKALTEVSLPKATYFDMYAFTGCTALTTVALPAATSIDASAFFNCSALTSLKLGATPPIGVNDYTFNGSPTPRYLTLVDADGNPLTSAARQAAIAAYKADGGWNNSTWHGWSLMLSIDATANPADGGTVSGMGNFGSGTTATLTATANAGYQFVRWSDGINELSTDNPYSFTVDDDAELVAEFETVLTVKVNGGAEITANTLGAAIAASGEELGGIRSIEITAGFFTTADWTYLESNKDALASLESFAIADGIGSLADMPDSYSSTFNSALKSVSIDASIAIGARAFYGCINLSSVTLPNAISIGEQAFEGCKALTAVSLPAATSIGDYAFSSCEALGEVGLPAATSVGQYAFADCSALYEVSIPVATSIGASAFQNCTDLTEVHLPAATSIGSFAFSSCKALVTVNMPVVVYIENDAFHDCTQLTTVSLPAATGIDANAFLECTALTSLKLGATPPTVVSGAFGNCPSPRYLSLVDADGSPLTGAARQAALAAYTGNSGWDNSTSTWHGWSLMLLIGATPSPAEGGTVSGTGNVVSGTTVTLTATAAEGYQFVRWSDGTNELSTDNPYSFTASSDVEMVAEFERFLSVRLNGGTAITQTSLEEAIATSGMDYVDITSIEITAGTFVAEDWTYLKTNKGNLISLASFAITDGISLVADMLTESVFGSTLSSVSIDASLAIGSSAFNGCSGLVSISLPAVTSIGGSAFEGCTALAEAILPAVVSVGSYAFSGCEALATVSLPVATSIDGYVFESCHSLAAVSLPVATSIGNEAFSGCSVLTSVSLPAATSIAYGAFSGCTALATVSLPVATSIGGEAFYDCVALTSLELRATPPTVLGDNVFVGCPSPRYLKLVDADGSPLAGAARQAALAAYKGDGSYDESTYTWQGWHLMLSIAATANPAEGGTVAGTGNIGSGITATLTAMPAEGYSFVRWSNGATANPYSFTATDDVELVAEFKQSLTVKLNDGASFTANSLEAAITASGEPMSNIASIEITAGDFTTADWRYLASNSNSLMWLESFTIANGIGSVADMPNLFGEAYFSYALNSVSIDASIAIGSDAFLGCHALSTVNLPAATSIGDGAFRGCNSLTAVSMPEVTSIGENAFYYCQTLTTVNMPAATSVGQYAFADCPALTTVSLPAATSIGEWTFSHCYALSRVNLSAVGSIAAHAFYMCYGLTFMELGATPPAVQQSIFGDCPSPRYLTVDDSAVDAYQAVDDGDTGDNQWYGWLINEQPAQLAITVKVNDGEEKSGNTLQEAVAASGVEPTDVIQLEVLSGELLGPDAVYMKGSLTALEKLTLTTATEFGLRLEYYGSLQELHAPLLETVGDDAFSGCYALTTVNLPAATSIGEYAFSRCGAISELSLPAATSIGEYAFSRCGAISELSLPAATNIDQFAFYNCTALTTVSLPAASSIGIDAFSGCDALTFMELGATPPALVGKNFGNCPSPRYLTVDDSAVDAYTAEDDGDTGDNLWYGWLINVQPVEITIKVNGGAEKSGLSLAAAIAASGAVPADVVQLEVLSGDLLASDAAYIVSSLTALEKLTLATTTELGLRLQNHPSLQEVNAPLLEIVGDYAFSGCDALTTVNMPAATSLGQYAFADCPALATVSLPAATSLGQYAFSRCIALTTASLPAVTNIENGVFLLCSALTEVSIPAVASIDQHVFYYCAALTYLELGATPPTTVLYNAFDGCTSPRYLLLVDADGKPLKGDALAAAVSAYRVYNDGDTNDEEWYGWTLTEAYTLTLSAANGALTASPSGNVIEGAEVALTATPAIGYKLKRLTAHKTGDASTTVAIASNKFTMPAYDVTVEAVFIDASINLYTLTYYAAAGGRIEGEATQTVEEGQSGIEVLAVAADGYKFLRWSDGRTDNPRTDTNVLADVAVEAEFVAEDVTLFTLTYTAGEGGSIEGAAQQSVVEGGNGIAVTAVANQRYRFAQWSDGLTTATRQDENVTENLTVEAEFIKQGVIDYMAAAGGRIEGEARQQLDLGSTTTAVTAIPDKGYRFVNWSDGVTEATRTDVVEADDLTLIARFELIRYALTISVIDADAKPIAFAKVAIGGKELKANDKGMAVDTLVPETYAYTVECEGYNAKSGEVVLNSDTLVKVVLSKTATGLFNGSTIESLSVYPNPTMGGIYVEGNGDEVRIFGLGGQLVLQQPAFGRTYVDLSTLPAGTYIVCLGNARAKVVKQ